MKYMQTQIQTAVEVLAIAVCELFPNAQRLKAYTTGIGYAYDFQLEQQIDQPLFSLIEAKMREIAKRNTPIEQVEMMRSNAQELFRHQGQFALVEELDQEESQTLSLIRIGTFYDPCIPGIGSHTGEIGAIHLTHCEKIGSEGIIRLHGLIHDDKKSLNTFIKHLEKAKPFDHLLLGEKLKLFLSKDETILWLPKGVELRRQLRNWWEQAHIEQNFNFSYTPPGNTPLDFKQDSRFCEIYPNFEPSTVYPFFRGLFTVPVETADLASIYCSRDELIQEITSSLQFIEQTINMFAFEHHWYLIAGGRQKTGQISLLQEALQQCNLKYEEDRGIAKQRVEMRIKDAFGEEWPGPWIEIDEKKNLIRRSLFGSMERFIALMIEKNRGSIPFWLAPEQVRIIVVNGRNTSFASKLAAELAKVCGRSKLDTSDKSVGQRVKAAIEEQIPYITVIGDREEQSNSVSLWQEDNREINKATQAFIEEIAKKIKG